MKPIAIPLIRGSLMSIKIRTVGMKDNRNSMKSSRSSSAIIYFIAKYANIPTTTTKTKRTFTGSGKASIIGMVIVRY